MLTIAHQLVHHVHTLILFTRADFKTIVTPVVLFALTTTPIHPRTLPHSLQTLVWVWLHLLHHDIANQSTPSSIAEDAVNKPDRPLPSGRITLRAAKNLRWVVAMACLVWSALVYGHDMACLTALILVIAYVYNDLHADAHWFVRDMTNAIAFAMFEVGACLVASPQRPISHTLAALPTATTLSILINALLYLTTNFSQDFKDVEGDSRAGRLTLPIMVPSLARAILPPILMAWAVGLSVFWRLGSSLAAGFIGSAFIIGARFAVQRELKDDKKSTQLYLGWLSFAHLLPAYNRITNVVM